MVLRERAAASQHRRRIEDSTNVANALGLGATSARQSQPQPNAVQDGHGSNSSRVRRQRNGRLRVETNRPKIVYTPESVGDSFGPLLTTKSTMAIVQLLYLLSPVQPQRAIQKLLLNICLHAESRKIFLNSFTALLNDDKAGVLKIVEKIDSDVKSEQPNIGVGQSDIDFPPNTLIGNAPDISEASTSNPNLGLLRRRQGGNSAATVAASLPASARGSFHDESIPPVVARRIISILSYLSKASPRICVSMLSSSDDCDCDLGETLSKSTPMERLLDLLEMNLYSKSAANLEQLLSLLENVVAPLSFLPKDSEQVIDTSTERLTPGKEWIKVPQVVVSKRRLHLLCSVLRLESCKDSSFMKVNTLTRRLSRVEANRECILSELALVAQGLGADAIRDLKTLRIRLSAAAKLHQEKLHVSKSESDNSAHQSGSGPASKSPAPSSAVSLSTSSSELKLLRVLQTLHSLCGEFTHDDGTKNDEGNSPEFVSLLRSIDLDSLWRQLNGKSYYLLVLHVVHS